VTDDTEAVKPRIRKLAFALFVILEVVSLLPLVLMLQSGGGSAGSLWRDAGTRNTVLVCCVAPALMVLGIVGARRGWSRGVLALLGLAGLAWPAFVAWMILHFPKC
jgi:hypothetical protein